MIDSPSNMLFILNDDANTTMDESVTYFEIIIKSYFEKKNNTEKAIIVIQGGNNNHFDCFWTDDFIKCSKTTDFKK